jgi:hypothetical protein
VGRRRGVSIGIEWMRVLRCRAIAIEPHPTRLQYIADNAAALGTPDLDHRRRGTAALQDLPPPDAVFIGGDDGKPLATCWHALPASGRLVANAITVESEQISCTGIVSVEENSPALPFNAPSRSARFWGGKRKHLSRNGQSRNYSLKCPSSPRRACRNTSMTGLLQCDWR